MALIKKGERNQLKDGHMQVKTVKSISVKLRFMSGNKYTQQCSKICCSYYRSNMVSDKLLLTNNADFKYVPERNSLGWYIHYKKMLHPLKPRQNCFWYMNPFIC
jgi:hypothetical protein